MKDYGKLIFGELIFIILFFQFLPDKHGGCGLGCHPGHNYGWPFPFICRFYDKLNKMEKFGYPTGDIEIWVSNLITNIIVIFILILFTWLVLKKFRIFFWSKLQLITNILILIFLLFLNFYYSYFGLLNRDDFIKAKYFFKGWPIPHTYIIDRQFHNLYDLDIFNLIIVFMLPILFALIIGKFNNKINSEQNHST